MKKFKLGFITAAVIISAMLFTGCGNNTTGNVDTGNAQNGEQAAAGGSPDGTDNRTAKNNDSTKSDKTQNSRQTADNNIVGGVAGNITNGLEDGAEAAIDNTAGAIDSVGGTIDGGTITNRAGSLFSGNDGIGMRGAENIRGNEMLR